MAALLGLAAGHPARADASGTRWRGRLVDVRILVDGTPTPLYTRASDANRHYFEAVRTERYAIELRNRTARRVGVLIAVDGLNVISGTRSGLGAHESLYVLGPRERTIVRGWRTSMDQVRQFVFVDEERSYAERSGQANGSMGWIHVLAFEERVPLARTRLRPRCETPAESHGTPPAATLDESAADSAPATKSQTPSRATKPGEAYDTAEKPPRLDHDTDAFPGTGWGEPRRDRVEYTTFDPIAPPADQLILRYEYAAGLRALGLLPWRDRLDERDAGAFGFARPPRG